VKGEGPLLENLSLEELISLKPLPQKKKDLQNTYDAIKDIRKKLNKNKSLIGFCGGPWTVACYMICGKGDSKFKGAIEKISQEKASLVSLLNKLVDLSVSHLYQQYISGCDTLMIFESWAGLVPENEFNEILTDPVNRIIKKLKMLGVLAPIIVLPRGINEKIIDYIETVKMDIISVDYNIDMEWLIKNLKKDIILQGNLDPNKINRGGKELEDAVNKLLLNTKDRKHIYCSGHGLLPNTPIKNVERVIEIIKN
jgi:uroporphyrinogen decarboxylase